ncbi:MAG: hypothetical protein AAFY17_08780 [Cyanobacteria bacterium J06642_11]
MTIERQNQINQHHRLNWRQQLTACFWLVVTVTQSVGSIAWDFARTYRQAVKGEKLATQVRLLERCWKMTAKEREER